MSSIEQFGYKEELKRALTTRDLLVYGMIFMVPIAPFSIFGFVSNDAKGMVALAYLVGMFGMFFTAMSYAAMSEAFPVAGSVYSYVQRGVHEIAGFISGWLILLDYILVPSLLYIVSAVALHPLVPEVPSWVWMLGFIGFNAVVNLMGVQCTAKANLWLLGFELIVLAIFVVTGLVALYSGQGAGHLTMKPLYNPDVFNLATVVGATSIAVLSFLGFDGISTLSEESKGGPKAIGRVTLLSLLMVGVLFLLQTWIAADLAQGMTFKVPDSAFYEISRMAGGVWLERIVLISVVISAGIANAMAAQAAVSRILFAMARDGKLPMILAKVHPRYQTPYVSTILVSAISVAAGLYFLQNLEDLSRLVNFGALCSFLFLHVAVVNHYFVRQRSGDWLRHLVSPLLGFIVIGYVLYEMDQRAKIMGLCWLALGALYYLVITRVMKKAVALEI
ncbi:MAG: APC family permease [Herminiimonas sp.]|nr:APC family permease [Herminiimonas sp.]